MNVLFVLYESFESNSALHVHHFANHLTALGVSCAVAVPVGSLEPPIPGERRYATLGFGDPRSLATAFPDGRGPDVIHGWTPRERVRAFCEAVLRDHDATLFVHLEDNEDCLLERTLRGRPLPEGPVPGNLSHPARYRTFLAAARGITLIAEPLAEFVPSATPWTLLWPGADTGRFHPGIAPNPSLGLGSDTFVLAYTGNVHAANAREVRSVYVAAALLSREGCPAVVLRTGRNHCSFLGGDDSWARPHAVEMGFVPHAQMPSILAAADLLVQPGQPDTFNEYRFPSKLPEYLAMGKPVILPRANLGHHLVHLRDALVYPSVDALCILKAALMLVADPGLKDRLGAGAWAFARTRLDWRDSARMLLSFYEQVLRGPARRFVAPEPSGTVQGQES